MKKMNRRQWAEVAGSSVVGSVTAVNALAQVAPAAGTDPLQAARDNNKRLSGVLSKFEIPLATEPAFQFKA